MKEEDYGVTDDDIEMDDNDTISNQDLSSEEWVVSVLWMFNSGAIANLKVGLVNPANYGYGTWFMNRKRRRMPGSSSRWSGGTWTSSWSWCVRPEQGCGCGANPKTTHSASSCTG